MSSSRRKFLQIGTAAVAVGSLAIAGDRILDETNQPRLVRIDVRVPSLPEAFDDFKIAQLSDFHYDRTFSLLPLRRAAAIVNRVKPDLVVLTGDFVTRPLWGGKWAKRAAIAIEPCSEILGALASSFGCFAVLGNHDLDTDPERITDSLQQHGIVVLCNRSVPLERMGARIWLSGVDDVLRGSPDLERTIRLVPRNEPNILLAHEPDYADFVSSHGCVALQLSGHSHGGQIRLPLVGPPYLPPLARKYPWGLRRIGNLTLYTNAGIGTIRVPVRLNCPPELTLFTLRQIDFAPTQQGGSDQETQDRNTDISTEPFYSLRLG